MTELRLTVVPDPATSHVRGFCADLNPSEEPQLLAVRPIAGSQQQDCFNNVDRMVKRDGGSCCYGWNIAEIPNVMIEAEFHAVWRSPSGDLIDVSPQLHGSDQILFLPDPNHGYDGEIVPGRRHPLVDHPVVADMIELAEFQEEALLSSGVETGQAVSIPMDQIRRRVGDPAKFRERFNRLAIRQRGRNDPCVCGSGRKFKKCCWFTYR